MKFPIIVLDKTDDAREKSALNELQNSKCEMKEQISGGKLCGLHAHKITCASKL